MLCNLLRLNNTKKMKYINIQTRAAYLVLLLMIANDIHPHPGPNIEDTCLRCHKTENNKDLAAASCDTCKGWCHLNCTEQRTEPNHILSNRFEWLCPNPTCQPNHHVGINSTVQPTTNRFDTLNSIKSADVQRKTKCRKKSKIRGKDENLLKHLPKISADDYQGNDTHKLVKNYKSKTVKCKIIDKENNARNHLTKISAKDYQGKDICKACNKIITKSQKAISCDACERWTHHKCSDMSMKKYKEHANEIFTWICNTCREAEIPITNKIDLKKLKPEELPISNSELLQSTDPDSLLILHYNCRSWANKETEVHNICRELNPSILCLTETWLDESTNQSSYVPDGYNIMRHDRSESFKQKYGKCDGGGIAIIYKEELRIQISTFMKNLKKPYG